MFGGMISSPSMLIPAAERVGMKVPADPDSFVPDEYPHFHVFVIMQIGRRMPHMGAHWENAEVIVSIPVELLPTLTVQDIVDRGFQ